MFFYTYHQNHNIKDVVLLIDGQNYRTQFVLIMICIVWTKNYKNFGSNYTELF